MGVVRTISTPKKICNFSTINAICTCKCNSSFFRHSSHDLQKSRSQLREKNLIFRKKKSDFRRAEISTEFDEQQHLDSVNFGEDFRLADMCDSQELSSTVPSFHFYLFFL